ncbi:MAG TPA: hypothetical protein VLZ55_09525 [Rhodanobacter sp.]|nr:hypothetical protein [Rhodanobacter sp.]
MKKRTACFGWTKKFQRRTQKARDLMAASMRERDASVSKQLRDLSAAAIASIKTDHRNRVKQLRGEVW